MLPIADAVTVKLRCGPRCLDEVVTGLFENDMHSISSVV